MAEVSNAFDLVTIPRDQPRDQAPRVEAKRVCTYVGKYNDRCNRDALDDAMVCAFHKGGATSLRAVRKELVAMLPEAMDTLRDLMQDDNGLVRFQATKLLFDQVDKNGAAGSSIDEEELEAARRSLAAKLDVVATRVLQRKTA